MQPDSRVLLDEVEVDFMAEKFSNVVDAVPGCSQHVTIMGLVKANLT